MAIAPPIEKSALNPASDIPNKRHCATSQRTIGALMMLSSVTGPDIVEVHAVKPCHQ